MDDLSPVMDVTPSNFMTDRHLQKPARVETLAGPVNPFLKSSAEFVVKEK